ncbi:MAG: hypothetical protein Q4B02_11485 [Propionibacteriaceae bacterium]|jgi:hypothetical protein|nr:hypothetical protein [Propionibacteriaceae bacterium]
MPFIFARAGSRRDSQLDKIDALFQGHYSRFTNQPVATFNPT